MRTATRRNERGEYLNPPHWSAPNLSSRHFRAWLRKRREVQAAHRARGEVLPTPVPDGAARLADATTGVTATWIGHSSFIVRVDGRTFALDPHWGARAGALGVGPARETPPGLAFEDVPRVDGIVLSHNHYDHFDAGTMKRFPRETPVACPEGLARYFRRWGFRTVTERRWWESVELAGVRWTFVPATHFSRRSLWDENRTLWGGWVMEHAGRSVYVVGDTAAQPDVFREIGERFPGLDAVLMPIGAYEPRWFMSYYHVNPREAAESFLAVGARRMVPMHWGTFRLADEALDEPPKDLAKAMDELKIPAEHVLWPGLGGTVRLA